MAWRDHYINDKPGGGYDSKYWLRLSAIGSVIVGGGVKRVVETVAAAATAVPPEVAKAAGREKE